MFWGGCNAIVSGAGCGKGAKIGAATIFSFSAAETVDPPRDIDSQNFAEESADAIGGTDSGSGDVDGDSALIGARSVAFWCTYCRYRTGLIAEL